MFTKSFLWRFGLPIAAALGTITALNALWNVSSFGLDANVPHSIAVYLPSSLVALFLLRRAVGKGRLERVSGWDRLSFTPWKVALGLGLTATLTLAILGTGGATPGITGPVLATFGFHYVHLLSASLAELLVFLAVGFCLTERWLRRSGARPATAALVASGFAAVSFGLYHYSHAAEWHSAVFFPLMPVMLINAAYFAVTRNLLVTLILHNAFAAGGFTAMQYAATAQYGGPVNVLSFGQLAPALVAFVVPLAVLLLVARHGRRGRTGWNFALSAEDGGRGPARDAHHLLSFAFPIDPLTSVSRARARKTGGPIHKSALQPLDGGRQPRSTSASAFSASNAGSALPW